MAKDPLRAALDDLQLDASSAKDRRYIEAMLRRLGYTETEIRAELERRQGSVAVPAPDTLAQDFSSDEPGSPPVAREYRLVVPARETAFSFAPPASLGRDSPFESFERVVETDDDAVEFEPVTAEEAPELEEFEEVLEPLETQDFDAAQDTAPDAFPVEERGEEFQELEAQEFAPAEEPPLADEPLHTFGGSVDAAPRTRVRVKRVRAKSRQEAEAKVAGKDRRVIKSIPVDIVERWGGSEDAGAAGKGRGGR